MNRPGAVPSKATPQRGLRNWTLPAGVGLIYATALPAAPQKVAAALRASLDIAVQVVWPLGIAFGMILGLNLLARPSLIPRFLGREAGVKGLFLSSVAGILSMGPIYAWYPFIQTLREKGVSNFHTANFLSNRSIKPAMLPVMVAYFGWKYTLIFSVLSLLGAWIAALAVHWLTK